MSIVDVTPPRPPRPGQTPLERLEDVCLEICQKYPFVGFDFGKGGFDSDKKLVSALTAEEKADLLKRAGEASLGVEGLIEVIRNNRGVYRDVLGELVRRKNPPLPDYKGI